MQSETDFSVRSGRLKIRLEWLVRALTLTMLVVANGQAYWLGRQFVSRTEFHDSLALLQKEVAAVTSPDQAKRLEELEDRLRALERKKR
ncbi:MAG: hypothetical protein DME22_15465 [Verrucomicrobia bacterium]|nr:MAG: hypothetical protein DME22_15465 [Verrucomicrobiota bacterium]